jgi:hypothetical protein
MNMATIEQYKSGWVCQAVRQSVQGIKAADGPLAGTGFGDALLHGVAPLAPCKLTLDQAEGFIDRAAVCAVGERMCRNSFPDAPVTRSVFLDELALALAEIGRARLVDKEQAKQVMREQKGRPIVISRVDGRYQEICRTLPENCIYWNMEKKGLRCLQHSAPPARGANAGGEPRGV